MTLKPVVAVVVAVAAVAEGEAVLVLAPPPWPCPDEVRREGAFPLPCPVSGKRERHPPSKASSTSAAVSSEPPRRLPQAWRPCSAGPALGRCRPSSCSPSSSACTCSPGTPSGARSSISRPLRCRAVWRLPAGVSTSGQALWRSRHCACLGQCYKTFILLRRRRSDQLRSIPSRSQV